jgi:hypothetical protein
VEKKGWVGFDLDGTLAENYERGKFDANKVGAPIQPMVDLAKKYIAEGYDVRLFTARDPHIAIRRWMRKNLGVVLPITNIKGKGLICLYDDRAVHVPANSGTFNKEDEKRVWDRKKR